MDFLMVRELATTRDTRLNTKANGKTERNTAKENGVMRKGISNTKANGKTESAMVKEDRIIKTES